MNIPQELFTNPNQPANAVVKTLNDGTIVYNDGSALLRDGTVLRSRFCNPWWVLANTYSTQSYPNQPTKNRNRRIWNGWVCKDMSNKERTDLCKTMGLNISELAPLNEAEERDLQATFSKYFDNPTLPDQESNYDFSNTYYPLLDLDRHVLRSELLINEAYVYASISLMNANTQSVRIENSVIGLIHFHHTNVLGNITVSGCEIYRDTVFDGISAGSLSLDLNEFNDVSMRKAKINGYVKLLSSKFHTLDMYCLSVNDIFWMKKIQLQHNASFNLLKSKLATFIEHCTFEQFFYMKSAQLDHKLSITHTHFKNWVPSFFGTELPPDTTIPTKEDLWPTARVKHSETNKPAYEYLRHQMNRLGKTDDENFVYRQELRCKAVLEPWYYRPLYWVYDKISDNGYSIARPAFWLIAMIVVFWALYGSVFKNVEAFQTLTPPLTAPITDGFTMSLSNTMPFLGIGKGAYTELFNDFPAWLKLMSAIQSLLGLVLLFFLGLGLRTRFRWR